MSEGAEMRIVVYQENGKWVAQCLEYDIRAQADTIEKLQSYIDIAISNTLGDSRERHGKIDHIDPAPDHFHQLWERRSADMQPREPARQQILAVALCA